MSRMVPVHARDVLSELRRGVLEHCVLAVVRDDESYGFDIVRTLARNGGLVTSEGTIYPLLSRLRRDGLVTTTWRESESGPPRRYYRITDEGRRSLDLFTDEWRRFRTAVDKLLANRPAEGGRDG
jgi:PadR family transcriptional regulator PadR